MGECKICGQSGLINKNGLYCCPYCSIVFTKREYSYNLDFFKDFFKEDFITQRQEVFNDFFANKNIKKLLGENLEVLDIGCAIGNFIKSCLMRTNWKLTGIDIAEDAIVAVKRELKDKADFFVADIESLAATGEKKFDLIFSSHTLEHINNPQAYIRSIAKVLKPGGLLYIEVPNERTNAMLWYTWRKNKFSRHQINNYYLNHAHGHVFFYNQKSLKRLLNDFEQIDVEFKQWPSISAGESWKIFVTKHIKKFLLWFFPYLRLSDRIIIIVKKCAESSAK